MACCKVRSYGISRGLFLVVLLPLAWQLSHATGSIEIWGEYNASNYNPASKAHERYSGTEVHATFVAKVSESSWIMSATNTGDGAFSQLWFDGTNTFTLNQMPLNGGSSTSLVATISPSKYYFPGNKDYLHISFLWLTYGLSPHIISSNHLGLVDIPLPWSVPRYQPNAYGYKWIISPSSDGTFMADCKVVRERALDLPDKEEMLRPELVYPGTVSERNRYRTLLDLRKTIPDGFVAADYKCEEWQRTNGWLLPVATAAKYYWADGGSYKNPYFEGRLKATKIIACTDEVSLPRPVDTTKVVDFRYRKFNGTRLYRGALYTLKAGDSWKSANDPVLLAEAEHYLKHGPRYEAFLSDHGKRIIIWLVFAVSLLIPCTAVLYGKHRKKKERTKATQ